MRYKILLLVLLTLCVKSKQQDNGKKLYVGGIYTAYYGSSVLDGISLYSEQDDDDQQNGLWSYLSSDPPKSAGSIEMIAPNGTVIYVAGRFKEANGTNLNNILRFDTISQTFSPLCGGVDGPVYWIRILKDSVFLGGSFQTAINCDGNSIIVNNVAVFNTTASSFMSLADGIAKSFINSIDIYEDEEGFIQVYAAGNTLDPEVPFVMGFIYPSGNSWFSIGPPVETTEMGNDYRVVAVDSTGNLYVGGTFISIGNQSLSHIARWESFNNTWIQIGEGLKSITALDVQVNAIAFGPSSQVVIGGYFQQAGSENVSNIAIWNGVAWSDLSGGIVAQDPSYDIQPSSRESGSTLACSNLKQRPFSGRVSDESNCYSLLAHVAGLFVFNESIIVTGLFTSAGSFNLQMNNIAFYNLTDGTWHGFGNDSMLSGATLISSASTEDGSIFAVGGYLEIGEETGVVFAEYRLATQTWSNLNDDPTVGFLGEAEIRAIAVNGTDIFVGGRFITAGSQEIHNIARWDTIESTWNPVGSGIQNGVVNSIVVIGDQLIIGGKFNYSYNGGEIHGIARWTQSTNSYDSMNATLVTSLVDCSVDDSIFTIAYSNEDQLLFFGGSFTSINVMMGDVNQTINGFNTAVYNLSSERWTSLGGGVSDYEGDAVVDVMVVSQNVQKESIVYVGGRFTIVGNQDTSNLAIWNIKNNMWENTPGIDLSSATCVPEILTIALNGTMPIIGGIFDDINNYQVNNIAAQVMVNGEPVWTNLGTGLLCIDNTIPAVYSVAYDERTDQVFAGGIFTQAGQTSVDNIARFSNKHWTNLEIGVSEWSGAVEVIELTLPSQVFTPTTPFVKTAVFGFIVFICAMLLATIVAVISYDFYKRKNIRSQYRSLGVMPEKDSIRIEDVALDSSVEQIPWNELELGSRISHGASGEVIQGFWKKRGAKSPGLAVAIKRVVWDQYNTSGSVNQSSGSLTTPKLLRDFLYEIKIMSSLSHENVLALLGVCITPKTADVLLVTELMEFGSVRDLLNRSGSETDWKLKLRLAIDACEGMMYLHSREPPIIHRDLKTSNLLVDKKFRCMIADFGISRIKSILTQNHTSSFGTPAYMSPEVISQNQYSEAADSYSFGVVLTELWSGDIPYSDTNLFPQQVMYAVVQEGLRPTIANDCPMALKLLIKDCLRAEPSMRPNFREIKTRLKRMSDS